MAIVYLYVRQKIKTSFKCLFQIIDYTLDLCNHGIFIPQSRCFQYEYQKGMPWRYETLTAPFDFPIHKTEDELRKNGKN